MARPDRTALLLAGALVLGPMVADAVIGHDVGWILHVVPFAALLLPLLLGRYVGENLLDRLRGARVRPVIRAPRSLGVEPLERGRLWATRLVGPQLAVRPPPAVG